MTHVDRHAARLPMLPLAEKALGQGRGLAQDQAPAGQRSRQAWLREMERAQMADWFQPSGIHGNTRGQGAAQTQTLRVSPAETLSRPIHGIAATSVVASKSIRPATSAMTLSIREVPMASEGASSLPMDTARADAAASALASLPRHAGSGLAATAYAAVGEGLVPMPMSAAVPSSVSAASQEASEPVAVPPEVSRAFIASAVPVPVLLPANIAKVAVHGISMPVLSGMAEPRTPVMARENVDVSQHRRATVEANWQNAAQSQGMRMHAQWTDSGVQLWLGMDGNAQQTSAQALAVVYSLQRLLRDQGQQLSRLVCNGKVVFDAASHAFGAMRTPHEFSDIFDRLTASRQRNFPVFLSPSSKEIS